MKMRHFFFDAFDLTSHNREDEAPRLLTKVILFAVPFFLLLPVFFQLAKGVFNSSSFYFNSEGELALLPIPLSAIMCFIGIYLGGLTTTRLTTTVLLSTALGMLIATALLSMGYAGINKSKLILLVQYVLPMCALVLGQQYGAKPNAVNIVAKAFTLVLSLAVPVQLISTWTTWTNGLHMLSPSLFFFSAYQHLQYIPVIFVGAFLLAIFTLWETRTYRPLLSLLAGLMGVYVALSLSMLAMGFLVLGMLFFFGHSVLSRRQRLSAFTITLVTASILIFSITLTNQELLKEKLGLYNHTPPIARLATDEIESKIDEIVINNSLTAPLEVTETNNAIDTATFATPQNIKERKEYLKVYLNPIIQNPTTLFFGHREPPDRNHYPSAHNYYLDFIYNFGIIAILPLLGLIGFTAYLIFRNFPKILTSSETLGLAGVVLFLVLIDNMFKVGMRQPFPGLMTFFLWGVLLAVLKKLNRPTAR